MSEVQLKNTLKEPQAYGPHLSIGEGDIMIDYFDEETRLRQTITMSDYVSGGNEKIKSTLNYYKQKGFYPVGIRFSGEDYPDYVKAFFELEEKNIKSGEEIIISLDETKFSPEREIILIQANVKSNPNTTKQITTFKDLITQILANKAI